MSEFDSLRQILNGKALMACQNLGVALILPNENITPPDDEVYVQFWFKTGGTKQIELGRAAAWELTVGIYQFEVYAPEKQGDGPATQIADALRKMFNRKEWEVAPWGVVKITKSNVCTPFAGVQGNKYLVISDGAFQYYHHDLSADPTFQ